MRDLLTPLPTLFDLAVAGFLGIFLVSGNDVRALYLVFYTMFLLMLSFGMKPKREYRSIPLMLLSLWAFLGLFIHSFVLSPRQVTYSWKIFYLTTEGFLYVLFGVVFIRTVVRYSTNIKFIYFLIPVAMLKLVPGMQRLGSSTMLVALGIATIIYLILSKKRTWGILASITGILAVVHNWTWLCFKFRSRPVAIRQMFFDMFYNPLRYDGTEVVDPGVQLAPWLEKSLPTWVLSFKGWLATIFGSGFPQYLNSDYKWVDVNGFKYGWVHKHNDYLNIANCLGPIALIFVIWFIVSTFKTIGIRPSLILFMAVVFTAMSQFTLYDPAKAAVALTITSISLTQGIQKGEAI